MKRWMFCLLALPALWTLGGGPIGRFNDGTARSHDPSQPMVYNVESGDLTTFYTNDVIRGLVQQAFGEWNNVEGSQLQITEGPQIGDIETLDDLQDSLNRGESPVVFDMDGSIATELGVSTSALAFAGPTGFQGLPYAQMFAVILGPASVGRTQDTMVSTLLHEFGHGLGLGHSTVNGYQFNFRIDYEDFGFPPQDSVEVMYWQSVARTVVPKADDISGYLALYGDTPQGTGGRGAISGRVFLPDGVTPADGINVIVRDRSGGAATVFTNAASIITAANGRGDFNIVGLPPGEYSVEIDDIGFGNMGGYSDPLRTDNNGSPNTILGPFPGEEEFYNGADESTNPDTDDPTAFTTVSVSANNSVTGINILVNRLAGTKGTLLQQVYYVPEIQAEGEGDTFIGIVNPDQLATRTFEVYGFSSLGDEVARGDLDAEIPPLGKVWLSVKETFPDDFGDIDWVQIGASGELHVFAEMTKPGTITAYWSSPNLETTAFMPHVAKDTTNFATFLATVNGKSESILTTLSAQPGGAPVDVPEHATGYTQARADVRDYFGDDLSAVDWVRLESMGPGENIGSASMEYFAILPDQTRIASLGLNSESGTTLRFLHVARDVGQFFTGLVYMNVGGQTANITETYYDDSGTSISTRDLQLDAGSKVSPPLLFDANNRDPEGTAWIEVTSDQPLVGYELFGNPATINHDYFAGLQGNYSDGTAIDYPHAIFSPTSFTGLVALNVGDNTGDVTFTAYNAAGTALQATEMPDIGPKVKLTLLARGLFSEETLAETAWIRATTTASRWAGFMLWGDAGVEQRQLLAGIKGSLRNLRQDPPEGITLITEEEDNNSYETAQELVREGSAWNINVVGFMDQLEANTPVDASGDDVEDLYKITLDEPTVLLIAVSPDDGLADFDLFIARGTFPITNSHFDVLQNQADFDWSAGAGGDESIMRLFEPGTYYILVSSWDSGQNPIQQTDYGLFISSSPLFAETFEDAASVANWSTAVLQNDTDGSAEYALMPSFTGKYQNAFVSQPPASGRQSTLALSPNFEVNGDGLTVFDADMTFAMNPAVTTPDSFGFGMTDWPGDGSILLFGVGSGASTTPVTFDGQSLTSIGWQSWASLNTDRSIRTVNIADGGMLGLALGADHTSGYVLFDNARAYNIVTSLAGKNAKRAGQVVTGRKGMSYHQKIRLGQAVPQPKTTLTLPQSK